MAQDEWVAAGPVLTAPEVLALLRRTIESASPLVVEHRHFQGAKAPTRFVSDDFEELARYLRAETCPGDSFVIWRFDLCCNDSNILTTGKMPDADGRVPKGGAY